MFYNTAVLFIQYVYRLCFISPLICASHFLVVVYNSTEFYIKGGWVDYEALFQLKSWRNW